jgi:CRISPR-associated protein Cas6
MKVTATRILDLLFPVVGQRLPTDHGYLLYGALSRTLPCVHDGSVPFSLAPITGQYVGNGLIQLDTQRSHLRLRLAETDIRRLLPLAGKGLQLMRHNICLGVPQVRALEPSPSLYARTVAIKRATDVASVCAAARRQLDEIKIGGRVRVPDHVVKGGSVEPQRRVLRIKEAIIVGYALLVEGLTDEESLRLQELGLGGRRRMGCGFFIPVHEEEDAQ